MSGASGPTGNKPLRYLFLPLPLWLQDAFEAGQVRSEALDVQLVLFKRADRDKLADRAETPKMRIESLAIALRRRTDPDGLESLKRLLRSYRADGLLGFRTEGTGKATVYVFTLFPDGPRRSAPVPPPDAARVPGLHQPETLMRSQTASRGTNGGSAPVTARAQAAVPPESASVPPSETPANPGHERDCAEPRKEAVPGASEVLEKTQAKDQSARREKGPLLEKGPARARAREEHPHLLPDVREAVNRARAARGEAPLDRVGEPVRITLELEDPDAEEELFAAFDDLVAEGAAEYLADPREPLCRYPAHHDRSRSRLESVRRDLAPSDDGPPARPGRNA